MKKVIHLSLWSMMLLLAASACQKVSKTTIYTANVPQYLTYEELRTSIHNDNERSLEKPGKIFLYNSLILINDFETGIHIYDNSNPSSPSHLAFINIPGNVDIAVRDNILYVDSYVDLVAIDISDPTQIREVDRAQDVLSYTIPSSLDWSYPVAKVDPELGVVTGFEIGEVEESCENEECRTYYSNNMSEDWSGTWNGQMMSDNGSPVSFSGNANNVRSSATSSNSGIAGSMARFMMIDHYLYVISDQFTVQVFDISTNNMREVYAFNPWQEAGGRGVIETLFTFKGHLFIGSTAGMLAYDVSNPAQPDFLSSYSHVTSCDPVVANDQYAFVTLRSGTQCNAWANTNINQMDVLDITDIMNPSMITSVQLSSPHGLDIDSDESLAFVCDGLDGLKVYDFTSVADIAANRVNHVSGMHTYDIILNNGIAHVIGDEGLKQFSYDNTGNLIELSTIALD